VSDSVPASQHSTAALRAELARSFLDEADAQLASLNVAADRGDLEALRQIAHRIKGAAATVAAAAASRVAGRIEAAAALGEAAG
jgi:HPt (histidine-containing phosphotransfer) domain-containing protein